MTDQVTDPTRTVLYQRPTYRIADGLVAGAVGGLLMGIVTMALFPLVGAGGVWQPMNLIGAVFDQSWGALSGFVIVPSLAGLTVHLATSALLGALFAWAAGRTGWRAAGALLLGTVAFALGVWLVAQYVVLPLVNPVMAAAFPLWLYAASWSPLGHVLVFMLVFLFMGLLVWPIVA